MSTSAASSSRIAIVIHCFYLDASQTILHKLAQLTFEYDLYVTASDESVAHSVESAVQNLECIQSCLIALTPNVGRNFGPFLVEFRRDLMNYDLICHIHTKKSAHHGDLAGWGDYLIDALIGDPESVSSIVNYLVDNPSCGLVCPPLFSSLPPWSRHWLGNYSIGDDWARRSGIRVNPGFINYPVGGMFWGKPTAIRQLLTFEWSYDDFPEELAQVDGTIHHAIERLVGAVCEYNGFFQATFDRSDMKILPLSHESSQSGPLILPGKMRLRRDTKVVSFDLFSAFLPRFERAYLESIMGVGHSLVSSGLIDSLDEYVLYRECAELRSRFDGRSSGNLCTGELERSLQRRFGVYGRNLLEEEFELLSLSLTADQKFCDLYRAVAASGIPVAIVADSVYSSSMLDSLRSQAGLPAPYKYFISSEIRGLKADGSIWNSVATQIGCEKWQIAHVGTDVLSDVSIPLSESVQAFLF